VDKIIDYRTEFYGIVDYITNRLEEISSIDKEPIEYKYKFTKNRKDQEPLIFDEQKDTKRSE
jgi:hypothetical protein